MINCVRTIEYREFHRVQAVEYRESHRVTAVEYAGYYRAWNGEEICERENIQFLQCLCLLLVGYSSIVLCLC